MVDLFWPQQQQRTWNWSVNPKRWRHLDRPYIWNLNVSWFICNSSDIYVCIVFSFNIAYIREPTATALAPVPRSGQAGFFNSVKNNVALVVISSLAILLLMLLLVAVLLLGRTRSRQRELSAVNRYVPLRNESIFCKEYIYIYIYPFQKLLPQRTPLRWSINATYD